MFDSAVDLLKNLSPTVAAKNQDVLSALSSSLEGEEAASCDHRPNALSTDVPPRPTALSERRERCPEDSIPASGLEALADEIVEKLGRLVASVAIDEVDENAGMAIFGRLVKGERLMAAGRALMARSLEPTDVWRREGFRSVGSWMASRLGVPAGPAIEAIEMVRRLDDLPLAAEAFRSGWLSIAQAVAVADVASEWPDAEEQLVCAAQKLSLKELQGYRYLGGPGTWGWVPPDRAPARC